MLMVMLVPGLMVICFLKRFLPDDLAFDSGEDKIVGCASKMPADCASVIDGDGDLHGRFFLVELPNYGQ